MSYKLKELCESRIWVEIGTEGGNTYTVNGALKCLALRRGYCKNKAGLGTDHDGTGRCKFHGGLGGRPIETGRYANKAKKKLTDSIREYMNDPNLKDLTAELALQRSVAEKYLEYFENAPDQSDEELLYLKKITDQTNYIVQTVGKIETISNQKVITAASAKLMMAKAVDTARKLLYQWFENPDEAESRLRQFIEEWREEVETPLLEGR